MKKYNGYSLIELLVVLAIIAFLSALLLPSLFKFLAKSKRTEAYVTLRSLYMAEKAHWLEQNTYTNLLQGAGSLSWKPEGQLLYTYGFSGADGISCIIGSLKASPNSLAKAYATANEFLILAAADIDGDGDLDILSIDQNGKVTIINDDL